MDTDNERPMPPRNLFARLRDLHRTAWVAPHELEDRLNGPGQDPNGKMDDDAVRPLHIAAISPMPRAAAGVRALLAAGADPDLADAMGAPPAFWAARWGEAAALAELIRGTQGVADRLDAWQRGIAHWWAMGNDDVGEASDQLLLDEGVPFQLLDHLGAAPIHWAAAIGGRVERLLALDGDFAMLPDRAGFLPIHYAAGAGITLQAVPQLIAAGADPDRAAGQFWPADFLADDMKDEWTSLTGGGRPEGPAGSVA